jgi:hypothetical protein
MDKGLLMVDTGANVDILSVSWDFHCDKAFCDLPAATR